MNITKEYYDYATNAKNAIPIYTYYCEKYSPIHKCNKILKQIKEAEGDIEQVMSLSKRSSTFNNQHLKFASAATSIKQKLINIEVDLKSLKDNETINATLSNSEKVILNNCLDLLNSKATDLTRKFQKFLQSQAAKIKLMEDKKKGMTQSQFVPNELQHDPGYSMISTVDDDSLFDVQTHIEKPSQSYYQDRLGEIKVINKMMNELATMINQMNSMLANQSLLVDNINQNTVEAYENVKKGQEELKTHLDNMTCKRLIVKVLLIIIVSAVLFIIIFA